jgi:hypothetical protein
VPAYADGAVQSQFCHPSAAVTGQTSQPTPWPRDILRATRAGSSVVERQLEELRVAGSIPARSTNERTHQFQSGLVGSGVLSVTGIRSAHCMKVESLGIIIERYVAEFGGHTNELVRNALVKTLTLRIDDRRAACAPCAFPRDTILIGASIAALPCPRGRPDAPSSSAPHGSCWLTSWRGGRTEKAPHDANLMVMCYSTGTC